MRTFEYTERHADEPDYYYHKTLTSNTPIIDRPSMLRDDDGGFGTLFNYAIETDQWLHLHVTLGLSEFTLREITTK